MGISLNSTPDWIIWKTNKQTGNIGADLAYIDSLKSSKDPDCRWWNEALWKLKIASKVKYFCWLAFNHRFLTWDSLQHRGFSGPGRCIFCLSDSESAEHIFGRCYVFIHIVQDIFHKLRGVWHGDLSSFVDNFE